jgi:hypothetical protein
VGNKNFDPKLKQAIKEFDAICRKYDCMGSALFVSPTHAEFRNVIDSTWSLMKYELPDRVRFRSKKTDFKDEREQHAATEATVHGVTSLINWHQGSLDIWNRLLLILRDHMQIIYRIWDLSDPDQ